MDFCSQPTVFVTMVFGFGGLRGWRFHMTQPQSHPGLKTKSSFLYGIKCTLHYFLFLGMRFFLKDIDITQKLL